MIALCVLLGTGILFLVSRPPRGVPIALLPAPTEAPLMVSIHGAVNASGLYSLPPGSRVNDAIQAAGGFSASADRDALNLARLVQDGEKIVVIEKPQPGTIPSSGEPTPVPPEMTPDPGRSVTLPALVDINTATLAQLDTLPGIGPSIGQLIIEYRLAHGPFKTIEEIMNVSKIGPVTFDKIKALITVGTSP